VDKNPSVPQYRRDLAVALRVLAERQLAAGDEQAARGNLEASREHLEFLLAKEPDNVDFQDLLQATLDLLEN
jgi:hypothetical protein